MIMYNCTIDGCDYFSTGFLNLMKHRANNHWKSKFEMACLYSTKCSSSFSTIAHFYRHARLQHNFLYACSKKKKLNQDDVVKFYDALKLENNGNIPGFITFNNMNETMLDEQNFTLEMEDEIQSHEEMTNNRLDDRSEDCQINIAQKLRFDYKVNAKTCNYIMKQFSNICEISYNDGFTASAENINKRNILASEFLSVNSERKRKKILHNSMKFVDPCSIILNPCNLPSTQNKTFSIEYVSILRSIKVIMEQTMMQDLFFNCQNRAKSTTSNVLHDFTDGIHCRNNKLLRNPASLKIQLYIDEFGIVNPLRNRARRLKLTGVYFRLLNIPSYLRSSLSAINLVMLFPSRCLKFYSYGEIITPLLSDLKVLEEEGVTVFDSVNKKNVQLCGSLAMISGDNLASQNIGGFYESSGNYFCRVCMASKEDRKRSDIGDIPLRTVESYNTHMELIMEDPDLQKTYGLKTPCPFNELEHFHCINGTPGDVFHNIFEGVAVYFVEDLLSHFVNSEYFSKDDLKRMIVQFPYSGSDKVNKPTDLHFDADIKIKLTAIQMWCFLLTLPLIIGSYIPQDNAHWKMFLTLRKIIEYLMGFEILDWEILELDDLIKEFMHKHLDLINDLLKPKYHYTLHAAHEIRHYGPLVHCGTIRFEAYHNLFKEQMSRTKNRKNIAKSLAMYHQEYMCHVFENTKWPLSFESRVLMSKSTAERDLVFEILETANISVETHEISFYKHISKGNSELVLKSVFPLQTRISVESFAFIEYLFTLTERVSGKCSYFCIYKVLDVLGFYHHFFSYEVSNPLENLAYKVVCLDTIRLHDLQLLSLYKINDIWLVTLKRNIPKHRNFLQA